MEKKRASNIRTKAFKKLDKLLVDFDTNFSNNGGKLFWANDADDAKQMISDILSQEKVQKILKEEMEGVVNFNVPLVAEVGVGKDWYTAK